MTYVGMCESPQGHIIVLSNDEDSAKRALYKEWKRNVYEGFATEKNIRNFADLAEWNGANVKGIAKFDKPVVWELL